MTLESAIKRNRERIRKARIAILDGRRAYVREILNDWHGMGWEGNETSVLEFERMCEELGCGIDDYPASTPSFAPLPRKARK